MPKLAQFLRTLARNGQYGWTRKPNNYFMSESYCSFYWDNHGVVPNHETWVAVAKLSARYHRFHHYVTEIAAGWVEIDRVHYADNSIESVQRASDGRTRKVQVLAPGGDLCF